jgi:hypothetical protein
MKITQAALNKILKGYPKETTFSCFTERNGRGDYGRDETYSVAGKPQFRLSIAFSAPYTQAFDLRNQS